MKRPSCLSLWLAIVLLVITLACSLMPGSTAEEPENVPATEQVQTEPPVLATEAPTSDTVQPDAPTTETSAPPTETSVPPTETVAAPTATVAPPTPSADAMEQWAILATASSEYGNPDWGAIQVIGAPNTSECGDIATAWASTASDSPYEWLELTYAIPVYPEQIRVFETYNPGSIVRVEVITVASDYVVVWEDGPRVGEACPHVLVIPVEGIELRVSGVRLTLDQSVISDWNEIDAVQLIGRMFD